MMSYILYFIFRASISGYKLDNEQARQEVESAPKNVRKLIGKPKLFGQDGTLGLEKVDVLENIPLIRLRIVQKVLQSFLWSKTPFSAESVWPFLGHSVFPPPGVTKRT